MNYGDLIEEVIDTTVRPDRERQARRSINSIVRTISLGANYWRDLREEILSEGTDYKAQKGQPVKTITLPDRFRKVAYIRRNIVTSAQLAAAAAGAVAGGQLVSSFGDALEYNEIRPNQIRAEGRLVPQSYYLSGQNLILHQQVVDEVVLWGYYDYPARFTDPDDENWITQLMPDLVIDWAAQHLMASLGDRDRTAGFQALQTIQLSVFVDEAIRTHETDARTGR